MSQRDAQVRPRNNTVTQRPAVAVAQRPEVDDALSARARMWGALHERLGRAGVAELMREGPRDAMELQILHLAGFSEGSGMDASGYLPWNAALSWQERVGPAYLAWWDELTREWATREPSASVGARAWETLTGVSPEADAVGPRAEQVFSALAAQKMGAPDEQSMWASDAVGEALLSQLGGLVPDTSTADVDGQDEAKASFTAQSLMLDLASALGEDAGVVDTLRGALDTASMADFSPESAHDPNAGLLSGTGVAGLLFSPEGEAVAREARGGEGEIDAGPALARALRARGGAPLGAELRSLLESRLGVDLSGLRVHTDATASRAAEAVNALAFTVGEDIYFRAGAFDPGSPVGRERIAHEATHVAQFLEGRDGAATSTEGGVGVTTPGDAVEQEAEAVGRAFSQETASGLDSAGSDSALSDGAGPETQDAALAEAPGGQAVESGGESGVVARQSTPRRRQPNTNAAPNQQNARAMEDVTESADAALNAVANNEGVTPPSADGGLTNTDARETRPRSDELAVMEQQFRDDNNAGLSQADEEEEAQEEEDSEAEEEINGDANPGGEVDPAGDGSTGDSSTGPDVDVSSPDGAGEDASLLLPEGTSVAQVEGGARSLPSELPGGTVAPATGGQKVELDGLVDQYMATHWDQSDLTAKTAEFGVYPDAIATETDRWLPANTPPGVRTAANLLVGLGAGLMDAFFIEFAKSIPGFGLIAHFLGGLKDAWKDCSAYVENGDILGAVFMGVRHTVSTVGGMAGNLGDLATAVADTSHVLAPFVAGLSEIIGVPAAGIASGCQAVNGFCTNALAVIDVLMIPYNLIKAHGAEAEGQFTKAAFFRDQARGQVFRSVTSVLKAVAAWVGAGTAGVVPGGAPGNMAQLLSTSGQKFIDTLGSLGGSNGYDTAGNVVDRFSGAGDTLGGLGQGYNNLLAASGFGDAMKRTSDGFMGGHYIGREQLGASGTEAALILAAARSGTIDQMNADWTSLQGEPPLWHQDVINKIVAPESGSWVLQGLNIATQPSEWLRLQFAGMRHVMTFLGDTGLEAVAGMASLAESALTGIAQPFIDNINEWIGENKPRLDEWLQELSTKLSEQRISLEFIRNMLTGAENMVQSVADFANEGGVVDQTLDPLINRVGGIRLEGSSLGIPDWVPSRLYQWALDRINGLFQRAAGGIRNIKNTIREGVDAKLDQVTDWAQEKIDMLQESLSEGGEVETLMNEQLAEVQQLVAQATEAFAAWDGQIPLDFNGAAEWLNSVAEQASSATNSARQERWLEYIRTVAAAYVEQWKARHSEEVHRNYYPAMPPAELSAVNEAYQLLLNNYTEVAASDSPDAGVASERLGELQAAYQACVAFSGQTGRGPLQGLWAAEERLARLATLPLPERPPAEEEEGEGEGTTPPVAPSPVTIHFAFDRPKPGGRDGMTNTGELAAAVDMVNGAAGFQIEVEGHASTEGSDAYNMGLAQRRANLVASQLPGGASNVRVTALGEAAAGQASGEYRHEDWRKVVVRAVGAPTPSTGSGE